MNPSNNPLLPFGLTAPWFALGIVNPELLERMREEWERGHDDNPEHYRWWAFREFVVNHGELTEELAAALYELGDNDADRSMGGAMMAEIVRRPECPGQVIQQALSSGRKHLVRLAQHRLRIEPNR